MKNFRILFLLLFSFTLFLACDEDDSTVDPIEEPDDGGIVDTPNDGTDDMDGGAAGMDDGTDDMDGGDDGTDDMDGGDDSMDGGDDGTDDMDGGDDNMDGGDDGTDDMDGGDDNMDSGDDAETGAVIYTGDPIVFSRPANVDFTLAENQDMITENVILTRGELRGLFNIAQENSFAMNSSPIDTEWAQGTTADLDNLTFMDWQNALGRNPPAAVGVDFVLHLITDDIFIDVRLLSWGRTAAGGGEFSYQRSTPE